MITPRQLKQGMLICLMAGCTTPPAATGTKPVASGPRALIHARYTGGLLNRQAEAVFKVEEGAYAMVAHLGGDGRIEVLYPQDGRELGHVPGGKWFRTQSVAAYYDAAPQLYSFAMNTYRTAGARLDSYDGRGYGFLFLIASKRPLRFDRISDFGLWHDLAPADSRTTIDPRTAIASLAETLAGGRPYTLKFARSTGTSAMTSYADHMYDCALLSQFEYSIFLSPFSFPFASFASFDALRMPGYSGGCPRSGSTYAYAPAIRFAPTQGTTPAAPTPRHDPLRPPPHRRLGEPRPGLAFGSPTRRNAPDNPAVAPRDWSSILRSGDGWPQSGGFGRRASPGTWFFGTRPSAGRPATGTPRDVPPASRPGDRTPAARPAPPSHTEPQGKPQGKP